jgi:hypothetical protein
MGHNPPSSNQLGQSGVTIPQFELDSRPGDAVLIAPVSKQIPWYQGILQGILRFWAYLDGFRSKKPLCRNDFSRNSLRELSGKRF